MTRRVVNVPHALTEAERLARRKRIVRVAKRKGLIDVSDNDAPVVALDDDDISGDG